MIFPIMTARILDDAGAKDVDEKSREWRAAGWNPKHGQAFSELRRNIRIVTNY